VVEDEGYIVFRHVRSELGCGVCSESLEVALRMLTHNVPEKVYSNVVEGAMHLSAQIQL